jgi:hypothetical protein
MKLIPAKLGASSKQVKTLGVLGLILVGVVIYNFSSSSTPVPMTARTPVASDPVPLKGMPTAPAAAPPRTSRRQNTRVEDFRPSLKLKEGTDVSKIDPTLRLGLLDKLKNAEMRGGTRSLFAFGAAPPPPVDPIHPPVMTTFIGPKPPPSEEEIAKREKEKADRAEKALPPIPLKFYGYSAKGGTKRAFFLDGDEIQVAGENELIKNRYKVIRIGVNSVVVEDTQNKHEQTIPLTEELAG